MSDYKLDGETRTRRSMTKAVQPSIAAATRKQQRNKMKVTDDRLNASSMNFPTDPFGLTTGVRGAVTKAVIKVGKDKERLKLLLDTIDVLVEHAKERFEFSKETLGKPLRKRSDRLTESEAGEVEEVETTESTEEPATKTKPKKVKPTKKGK